MTKISPVPSPEAEETILIPIAAIRVADRIRPVDPDHAEFLRQDILRHGLLTRIEVCHEGDGYRLVAGAHRLAACAALAWSEIPAVIRDHEALGRRAREISENLVRHELNALDRAAHLAELYALLLQEAGVGDGESARKVSALKRHGKPMPSADLLAATDDASATVALAYPLQDDIAAKVGLSKRAFQRDLQIYRNLSPSAAEALRGTKAERATTELLRLSGVDFDTQAKAVALLASGEAPNAAAAIRAAGGETKPATSKKPHEKLFSAFCSLDPREKARLLDAIAATVLPQGYSIRTPARAKGTAHG
jgi:ParB family chromosome partitioning protein